MKVGDLVKPAGKLAEELSQVNRDWAGPAIIVKGPYEGSHTRIDQMGRPAVTEIRMMIDVMVMGRIIEGLPSADFSRVTRREAGG